MSDSKIATAGDAPATAGEHTSAPDPGQPVVAPAFEREHSLDRFDRTNLLRAVEHLSDIVHDIGIGSVTVEVFRVDRESVMAMFPDAENHDYETEATGGVPFSVLSSVLGAGETTVKFFVNPVAS